MPRNPWGHFRRPPSKGIFEFKEEDGFKLLKEFGNSTAAAIRMEAPNIDLELFNARRFFERNAQISAEQRIASIKNRFPKVANWFYDDELAKAVSDGRQSERQCVNEIISARLNLPESTIERYRRVRHSQRQRD